MKTLSFNLESIKVLTKIDYNKDIKIIPTEILEKLELMDSFPVSKELAIKQICNFLMCLNDMLERNEKYGELIISQDIFLEFFNRDTYMRFKDILKELEIITPVLNAEGKLWDWEKGISKTYQVYSKYKKLTNHTLIFFDKKTKVIKNIDIQCELKEIMLKTLMEEELDYKMVFEKEIEHHLKNKTSNFNLLIRLSRALRIDTKRFAKTGNKVDRIYHSFSGLSRVCRKCFKTKYFNIDLKNSQPLLLLVYLVQNNLAYDNSYKEVCETGIIYEQFYSLDFNDDVNELRKTVKTSLYSEIFFDFKPKGRYNKRFKELYPIVWEVLETIHASDTSLASILQNIEADIFNNIDIKYSTKYYTLFDSIYYNNAKDTKVIMKQLNKIQKKLNIKFTLSYE